MNGDRPGGPFDGRIAGKQWGDTLAVEFNIGFFQAADIYQRR